jgi:hypothetical protein
VQRLIAAVIAAAAMGPHASGCYSYVPVAEPAAPLGDEVRVHLSDAGAADLAREIGPRMASIDARVIEVGPDSSLKLAVTQLRSMRGEPVAWQGDAPLVVPRSAIASLERRRLAQGRTVAASTAATAAAVAIGVLAVRGAGKGSGSGGSPPPPPP